MKFLYLFAAICFALAAAYWLAIGLVVFILGGLVLAVRYYRAGHFWRFSGVAALLLINAVLWSWLIAISG